MSAANAKTVIKLKLLIDKIQNRVVFAESGKDFVDVLFSFLTLPLGNIIKLIRKQQPSIAIGCLDSLYESIENLDLQHFESEACKSMLLNPRNSSVAECKKLKLNVDDTETTKYYLCSVCSVSFLSTSRNSKCYCGKLMNHEITVQGLGDQTGGDMEGVFVRGTATFLITDDLQVMPMSTTCSFAELKNFGVGDTNILEEKTIDVELEQVETLLSFLLISKTPLSGTFLSKTLGAGTLWLQQENVTQTRNMVQTANNYKEITIKFTVRKSNQKALFAEAGDDFIDFIFSMLTFPFGSM
ncbi:hypothetical protein GIB67_007611 [Kingdonia uniflora]|uniref:DUF674 family protein n=1 Tax=Kingdonia uniflora TaxID=39325 RepID=A0A7J7N1R4_9MAGN|nr:hypothetical protein GIB67_007611 [Kingdonia uniflora]